MKGNCILKQDNLDYCVVYSGGFTAIHKDNLATVTERGEKMITQFNDATNENVRSLLHTLNNSKSRVRLFYGSTELGAAWPEEFDVIGTISNSTGQRKIPILINNARSIGGPGILDHCIVAIVRTDGRWLYKHPNFDAGRWEHGAGGDCANCPFTVTHNGIVHARFKTHKQADNYIKFMTGQRFCK